MRFLIVNKFLYPNGGSETYIFNLGKQLESMGHEVQYFGMEHPDSCVGNNIGAYTANMDFHADEKSVSDWQSNTKLLRKLQKLMLPARIIYSWEARKQIRKVLDDFKPDVVHLNNINFQITPSIIYEVRAWEKAKADRCRIIYTAHDYQWICPNHMLYIPGKECEQGTVCDRCEGGKYTECIRHNCIHDSKARSLIGAAEGYYYKWRKTYSLVDKIICPSQFLYDKFSKNTLLRDKLIMLHNFIDTTEYPYKQKSGDYVLYFGRLAAEKGVNTLIRSMQQLADIPFIIAGNGPLTPKVQEISDKQDNIRYVGFKKGDELTVLIRNAAFSVYPSEWYENCPLSVMESISLGTPVLGADIGGIPELINTSTKATGDLFIAGSDQDLMSKIRSLWDDKCRITELSNNCTDNEFKSLFEYADDLVDICNR